MTKVGSFVSEQLKSKIMTTLSDATRNKLKTISTATVATALTELDARSLTPQVVGDTLGALLKYQDDIARMQGDTLQKVLKEATSD